MNEAVIRKKLAELGCAVAKAPKTGTNSDDDGFFIADLGGKYTIEESIEALGLQVKYMMFDLEATRRENRYLRQMLNTRPKGGEGPG